MVDSTAVDFRSDTVTRPSAAMLAAMTSAKVGDDVFGDDPSVEALEAETAELLGKESALFVASGTMSNQIAIMCHVGPLQEVLCDHRAHVHAWEAGGIHSLAGASVMAARPLGAAAFLCAEAVREYSRLDHCLHHQPVTKLLSLEHTQNGEVAPLSTLRECVTAARAIGLSTHLDGARLWNAAAAEGLSPDTYAHLFDSVSVCLSKGLGAPIGSLLVGSAAFIQRARGYRKLLGGGWRQAGVLAAAGRHAIKEHRGRLVEDHDNASELAAGLRELGFSVRPPQTNMVWCSPPPDVDFAPIQRALHMEGVLLGGAYKGPKCRNPFGDVAESLRVVTHLQTPRVACKRLIASLARHLKKLR